MLDNTSMRRVWSAVAAAIGIAIGVHFRTDLQRAAAVEPQETEAKTVDSEIFKTLDADKNGALTSDEYVAVDKTKEPLLRRDFLVFDADGNGRMSVAEFLTMPATPEDQRLAIPDPVVILSTKKFTEFSALWNEWDRDKDGSLSADEFQQAMPGRLVPGLESTGFNDWDLDTDGKLTANETRLLLDVAFGVRIPTGELVRFKNGQVLDFRMFRNLKPDAKWTVDRQEYIKAMGSTEAAEKWFPTILTGDGERFDVTAFATSGHRTDPVNQFLAMDVDLSGGLSPKELESLPVGWGPPGNKWLPGFDDDNSKTYSLWEFMLIPNVNLLFPWHHAQDANHDGRLSRDEFRFVPGPLFAALSAEYFRRLDQDQDGLLTLKEWPFQTTHPEAKFAGLDADSDGVLTEAEFIEEKSLPKERLQRDFKLFDGDGDGRMTTAEFLTIPYWVPEPLRTQIPDTVRLLSAAQFASLKQHWDEWDQDKNGTLQAGEFLTARVHEQIPGLGSTTFRDWDLNGDAQLSADEATRIVDAAYGVCVISGEPLRTKSGQIPDWRGFRGMDPDGDGRVTREEYLRLMSAVPNAADWYRNISKNDEESFGIAEFVACPYRTDPVGMFLGMDKDLNGRLTPDELGDIPADWGPPTRRWLQGFDDDHDGGYSLREFMLIPHVNLLTTWHGAKDSNEDGVLSMEEFRFATPPSLSALSAEYFRRLDLNHDTSLSLGEWPFQTTHPLAKFQVLDADADAELTVEEFTKEGSLPADRLTRDFKVFDADKNGRLSKTEFLTIQYWIAEPHQTPIPDPVVASSQSALAKLVQHWAQWDQDGDDSLSESEFKAAAPGKLVPGLEGTEFASWDLNKDGKLSRADAALLLDVAFGVRVASGELLRSKSGNVVDLNGFRGLDPDGDGRVTRSEYLKHMAGVPNVEDWYRGIAKDRDDFGIAEFVVSNHRTSPVLHFLQLDVNLDAQLSPEELKPIPWGPPTKQWLSGFDDDGDGGYSLFEFLRIPYINLSANWHTAVDKNVDGTLKLEEFAFVASPTLSAITAEYFHRLDANKDGSLSLNEWPFQTSHPDAKFNLLNRDGDDGLSLEEFLAEPSLPPERLKRDFRIFDLDSNGQMTRREFMAIPYWVSEEHRTVIPDPVMQLSDVHAAALLAKWSSWDHDSSGSLDKNEFKSAAVGRTIRGLEMTGLGDWDLNHDDSVTREEAATVVQIAFGVRSPTNEPLRSQFGCVVDWRGFQGLNPDSNGKVKREAYLKAMGPAHKVEVWFPFLLASGNDTFGIGDYLTSSHKTDPVNQFLHMDADLNGAISPTELESLPVGWGPPGHKWLPGFDDDQSGSYSLQEFRLLPHVNLLATWYGATDANADGKLSPQEFRFLPAPALAGLSMEYFRRLDVNQDGFLSPKEWTFNMDPARVPVDALLQLRDRNGDGKLSLAEVLGDLQRTGPTDSGRETTIVRIEEAFLRADRNHDGALDLSEVKSDDGRDALSPGAVVRAKSVPVPASVPISNMLEMDDATLRTYIIIEFNILLVIGVGIYLYRRRGAGR